MGRIKARLLDLMSDFDLPEGARERVKWIINKLEDDDFEDDFSDLYKYDMEDTYVGEYCYGGIRVAYSTYSTEPYPYFWPTWLGGNEDFIDKDQPFDRLQELRLATMLEF